jgi:hypothetical protein
MPMPKWFDQIGDGHDANHAKPKRHEEDVAKGLGGRRRPGSGSKPGMKGDVAGVQLGDIDFLIECKTTEGASLSVQGAWLNKITTEAGPARSPALAIRFQFKTLQEIATPHQKIAETDWVAIPMSVFKRMRGE